MKIRNRKRRREFITWYIQFPLMVLMPFLALFWLAVLI